MSKLIVILSIVFLLVACSEQESSSTDNSALKTFIKEPKDRAAGVGAELENREQERRKQLGFDE